MGAEAYLVEEDEKGGYRLRDCEHGDAYKADIVYGTKDQFGFDYLYDNMSIRPDDLMQREHHFAIIDEADSILIDEARTPLVISGAVPEADTQRFDEMRPLVEKLVKAQGRVVNGILTEAEKLLEDDEYEAGIRLVVVQRGMPKNKRLMKQLQEEGSKRLIGRVEADYMRDKRMGELDEDLYYSVDEKSHIIDLTEKGRVEISKSPDDFVLPDLDGVLHGIEKDESLEGEDRARAEDDAYQDYARKSESIHSVQQLLKAYSLYEKRCPVYGRRQPRDYRRRIYRTSAGRQTILGWTPPGAGGQGTGKSRKGHTDGSHDHTAKLLQALSQTSGNDGHGRNRELRTLPNLSARRGGHSHQRTHP